MHLKAELVIAILSFCSYVAAHDLRNVKSQSKSLSELRMGLKEQTVHKKMYQRILRATSLENLLMYSVSSRDYSEVKRLLAEGADPNYATETGIDVLGQAIAGDEGSIVTLLIEKGANKMGTESSHTRQVGSLHYCALFHSVNAAVALLKAGVPVDELNSMGQSALHFAASEGSGRMAALLLQKGASINVLTADNVGSAALHMAIFNHHYSMTMLLLSNRADPNLKTKLGDTPLHVAILDNSALIAQELITNGAETDVPNARGATPLHNAAYFGYHYSIEVLVRNGADKSVMAFHTTPLEVICNCLLVADDNCATSTCEHPRQLHKLLTCDPQ